MTIRRQFWRITLGIAMLGAAYPMAIAVRAAFQLAMLPQGGADNQAWAGPLMLAMFICFFAAVAVCVFVLIVEIAARWRRTLWRE